MAPEKVKLNDHYKGDYWSGMLIGPVLIDGIAPVTPLASVRLQFRDEDDLLGHEFNTVAGTGIGDIAITDSATWEISILPQLLNLTAGTWYYDLETTNSDGKILTLYRGTIKVTEDITS